jgi:hypothetical protein
VNNKINKILTLIFLAIFIAGFAFDVDSAFNQQINYQGKLTGPTGIAVPDSPPGYNLKFSLCTGSTCAAGGDPIWTETYCYSPDNGTTCNGTGTDSRVTATSGLFSVL